MAGRAGKSVCWHHAGTEKTAVRSGCEVKWAGLIGGLHAGGGGILQYW